MTSFTSIFQALFSRRFKRVISVWLLTLIIVVGGIAFAWFFQRDLFPQTRDELITSSIAVILLGSVIGDVVLLAEFALDDQKLWTQPTWRALPTRSWHLVIGSLLADLAAFSLFLLGCLAVMIGLSAIADGGNVFGDMTPTLWGDFFGFMSIWLTLHLFVWVFVSMVHMLSLSIVTFLPDRNARLLRSGINLLLAVLALYVIDLVSKPLFIPFRYLFDHAPSSPKVFIIGTLSLLGLSVVLSLLSLVIFDRWVEAEV